MKKEKTTGGELVNVSGQLTEMAQMLGYEGALTVGALEDGIRIYQRRTVEDCLELGKCLLLLKEITPHGEFQQRVELLGMAYRTAARFMQAAAKISQNCHLADLSSRVKSISSILELVTHDDDTLKEIAALDDIDCMSASALRARLRQLESKGAEEAKEERKRANRIQAQLEKSEDLLETLKSAQNLNPEFSLETSIVRQQSALLDGHCAASLALLEEMAQQIETGELGEADFQARFHCLWFSAHAVYARTLLLLEKLRDMGDGFIPESLDDFKAGQFTSAEAASYLNDLHTLRTALDGKQKEVRNSAEEAAPRKAGRPKGSTNKAKGE